jgi:hypothetical protein
MSCKPTSSKRRKGVHLIGSVDELQADVFEADDELDKFLADLEESRHEHMAWAMAGEAPIEPGKITAGVLWAAYALMLATAVQVFSSLLLF